MLCLNYNTPYKILPTPQTDFEIIKARDEFAEQQQRLDNLLAYLDDPELAALIHPSLLEADAREKLQQQLAQLTRDIEYLQSQRDATQPLEVQRQALELEMSALEQQLADEDRAFSEERATLRVPFDGVLQLNPQAGAVDPDGYLRLYPSIQWLASVEDRSRLYIEAPIENATWLAYPQEQLFLQVTLGTEVYECPFVGRSPGAIEAIYRFALPEATYREGQDLVDGMVAGASTIKITP